MLSSCWSREEVGLTAAAGGPLWSWRWGWEGGREEEVEEAEAAEVPEAREMPLR